MKWLAFVVLLGCWSSPPRPAPTNRAPIDAAIAPTDGVVTQPRTQKFSLEILGLMLVGNQPHPAAVSIAQQLTSALREIAYDNDRVRLGGSKHELLDELVMSNCTTAQTACMAKISRGLGADRIIFGELSGPPWEATIWLVVADAQHRVEWKGAVDIADVRATAREAITSLLSRSP